VTETATTFANHRGVVPMLWAFACLAACELLAVHLFVSLKWPSIAWVLTGATFLSIIWLVSWIRSWRKLPYRLEADRLVLPMGSLRTIEVPLSMIDTISTQVDRERIKAKGSANLVPLAFPNRIVELSEPLPGRKKTVRVAIRPDDPAAFDAAMQAAGIPVRP